MSINLTDEIEVKTKKGKLGAAKQIFLEGDTQTVENEIQDINSRHNDLNSKHESLSSTVSEHTNQIESNQNQITANKSTQDAKNASLDANMAKLNTRDDQITELVRGITATGGASVATTVTYDNTSSHLASATVQGAIDELQGSKIDKTSILQELGNAEDKVMSQKCVSQEIIQGGVYDVSAHNNDAVFESLQALLSSSNLNTLIPTSVRHVGMSIKFIQGSVPSSDNKYVQYMYIGTSTAVTDFANTDNWEKINLEKEFEQANKKINNLDKDVNGLPQVNIDLSNYELCNGIISGGVFHTYSNHRCKFIPIKEYQGRTIRLTIGSSTGYVAILKSRPYADSTPLDFATGYTQQIDITTGNSPYDIISDDAEYIYFYVQDIRTTEDHSLSTITVLSDDSNIYTKEEADAKFLTKDSIEDIKDIKDIVIKEEEVTTEYEIAYEGGRYTSDGSYVSDSGSARGIVVVPVVKGASYKITTYISSSLICGVIYTSDESVTVGQNLTTVIGTQYQGTGIGQTISDQPLNIPSGTTFIIAQSASLNEAEGQKVTKTGNTEVPNFYSKEQSDSRYIAKGDSYTKEQSDSRYVAKEDSVGIYGVKWSTSNYNDLGQRCFSSVGKNATIGIGSTNGYSDFDSIFPWSEMKRCNIKTNANGAKIVTFEGESGFALDGSNGDVFVRIPKFKTDHYIKDGEEYIIIGEGYTHPAFIENGVELDEIFVAAFEAFKSGDDLFSRAGVIPTSNITAIDFLASAKHRGNNYTLADMRSIDAIWKLMAVEYGCRNSNQVLGYGYSDYEQPVNSFPTLCVSVAVHSSNIVTGGKPSYNSERLVLLQTFAPGNNITICDTLQTNIVAQRKITNVQCSSLEDNLVITFDGEPLDLTTSMFFGNAASDTNYCESIGSIDSNYALQWHTGRANRPVVVGSGRETDMTNPCRYRWIENPVGNLWQFLPDVTFYNCQMYICKNMKDYVMHKHESPYLPIGSVLPDQNSNGSKADVNTVATPNYWITSLLNDVFAKGNNFGKTFDTVHDGTLTSKKGFGGYYYLYGTQNTSFIITNGGGFDHAFRSNMLTNRAWQDIDARWYLYGARLMFKDIE